MDTPHSRTEQNKGRNPSVFAPVIQQEATTIYDNKPENSILFCQQITSKFS